MMKGKRRRWIKGEDERGSEEDTKAESSCDFKSLILR